MYNPLTRTCETTLLPTLRELNMAFYGFSPLAGGFFSKSAAQLRTPAAGSRMDQMKHFANMYVSDFSLGLHEDLTKACEAEGVTVKEATLRWLVWHSGLRDQDGVILGASSAVQVEENLVATEGGRLPERVVEAFEEMWRKWKEAGKATPAWV